MYGLIHTALRGMVQEGFDESTWDQIVSRSGVPADSFLTMRSYEDDITLALVGAAAEVLELSVSDALEAFGEYWITEFAPNEYSMLLDHVGKTPFDFLRNLDDLHDRISTVFTEFKPPSFRVEVIDEKLARVTYRSGRSGLTPFVLGIMQGLDARFEQKVEIESIDMVEVPVGEQTIITLRLDD